MSPMETSLASDTSLKVKLVIRFLGPDFMGLFLAMKAKSSLTCAKDREAVIVKLINIADVFNRGLITSQFPLPSHF